MVRAVFVFKGGPNIEADFEDESHLCTFINDAEASGMYFFRGEGDNSMNERYPARNLAFITDREVKEDVN